MNSTELCIVNSIKSQLQELKLLSDIFTKYPFIQKIELIYEEKYADDGDVYFEGIEFKINDMGFYHDTYVCIDNDTKKGEEYPYRDLIELGKMGEDYSPIDDYDFKQEIEYLKTLDELGLTVDDFMKLVIIVEDLIIQYEVEGAITRESIEVMLEDIRKSFSVL